MSLQAFYLARTGRPGPVLVDVPKDIQQQLDMPDWDTPMAISGYMSRYGCFIAADRCSQLLTGMGLEASSCGCGGCLSS